MNANDLQAMLEEEYETELSRLGSSKSLYALTAGDMDAETVLAALASRAATAADTFDDWAETEANDAAQSVFEDMAAEERGHADRFADAGDVGIEGELTPLAEHLRDLGSTEERAAGLVAWALLTDRTLSQAVGFFVGSADRQLADLCREVRSDTDNQLDRALSLVDAVIEDEAVAPQAAASRAVELAYEQYVEVLEGMGIKVKPVC